MSSTDNKYAISYIQKTFFSFWIPAKESKIPHFNLKTVYIMDCNKKNPEWKVLTYEEYNNILSFLRTNCIKALRKNVNHMKHLSNKGLLKNVYFKV